MLRGYMRPRGHGISKGWKLGSTAAMACTVAPILLNLEKVKPPLIINDVVLEKKVIDCDHTLTMQHYVRFCSFWSHLREWHCAHLYSLFFFFCLCIIGLLLLMANAASNSPQPPLAWGQKYGATAAAGSLEMGTMKEVLSTGEQQKYPK